ncbi:MAG: class I SAM-dependent methyltransferase [Herpetosiphonaceae bacterium]|nr:class I SAM-dependent methyltransferase [Herpetosiphonaceae bacterium]
MSPSNVPSDEIVWDVESIYDGGERVTHLYPNDLYYSHLSIYYFALQFCQDALVLDAGSGSGYGSAYLADHGARFVHGIDVSEKGIAFSQHYFQRPNLQYQTMDVGHITGFEPHTFDFIFSSNVLEHVPDIKTFFPAAWRLLKPEGTMLVAVPPVPHIEGQAQNLMNQYHLNIWSQLQWRSMFQMYFSDVEYYQHLNQPDVNLDDFNAPEDVSITERDFVFNRIPYDQILTAPTHSAIFVIRNPRPSHELPDPAAPIRFIDDSFCLAPGDQATRDRLARSMVQVCHRALKYLAYYDEPKAMSVAELQPEIGVTQHNDAERIRHLEAMLSSNADWITRLETSIAEKNDHISKLETLHRRIGHGRLMRILNRFSR